MILDFYFVVGSHFRYPGLFFCSEFGATLLDGFVFCRPLFSTKSPVSTLTPNEQGDMGSESMLSKKPVVWILQQQISASSLWKAWLVLVDSSFF